MVVIADIFLLYWILIGMPLVFDFKDVYFYSSLMFRFFINISKMC